MAEQLLFLSPANILSHKQDPSKIIMHEKSLIKMSGEGFFEIISFRPHKYSHLVVSSQQLNPAFVRHNNGSVFGQQCQHVKVSTLVSMAITKPCLSKAVSRTVEFDGKCHRDSMNLFVNAQVSAIQQVCNKVMYYCEMGTRVLIEKCLLFRCGPNRKVSL